MAALPPPLNIFATPTLLNSTEKERHRKMEHREQMKSGKLSIGLREIDISRRLALSGPLIIISPHDGHGRDFLKFVTCEALAEALQSGHKYSSWIDYPGKMRKDA